MNTIPTPTASVRSPRAIRVKSLRTVQRAVHLVASVLLVVYLYTGLLGDDTWTAMIRFVVVPATALSGLALWQTPRVLRLWRAATDRQGRIGRR